MSDDAADRAARQLAREIQTIGVGVLVFLFVGMALLAFSQGPQHWALPVFIGLGVFFGGALIGFLFGIPKVVVSSLNAQSGEAPKASPILDPNTNLEQISDWLTKIIVGLGLVELHSVPSAVIDFAKATSPAFASGSDVPALATIIYFPVLGFVSGWLITRLYLSGLIGRADTALKEQHASAEAKGLPELQDSLSGSVTRTDPQAKVSAATAGLTEQQKTTLREASEALRDKPEAEYTAKDWGDRAFAAYADKKIALATEYFAEAARARDATTEQSALAFLNQGILADQLGRHDEAIASYDSAIRQFMTTGDPALRMTAAAAFMAKALALTNLRRFEEAIESYDTLLKYFQSAPESGMQQTVVTAMRNKGYVLGQLQRFEESVAVCDEAIRRFSDVPEARIQAQVAGCMRNKGVAL
ncbi:MAG: tetratricopeptide repeat protein, partial [Candidatus Eremiobacteraeota bacterium]|nr:tetratricopeptide repeat protein [Candidatus Eremiobacteraeota bacterium]